MFLIEQMTDAKLFLAKEKGQLL